MLDTVEPCQLLVVGANDGPGRQGPIGLVEHLKFPDGIIIPKVLGHAVNRGNFILL